MKKLILPLLLAIIAVLFFARIKLKETVESYLKPQLPQPLAASEFTANKIAGELTTGILNADASTSTAPSALTQSASIISPPPAPAAAQDFPESFNLAIPFASQAPLGNWDMPYQEACEEAAAIMVDRFFSGQPLSPQIMDGEILRLVDWEMSKFGYYKDTTAEEVAIILREYFGKRDVEVRYDITIDDIKREVSRGHPVIVPAAGRLLPNPNFRSPGPIYHALVIKGYTKDKIITNDPGTRNGADFLYDPAALMNAIHEWDPSDILAGRKAMIVVKS